MKVMQIGELARKTSCTVQTIRLYERSGLLKLPSRSARNYRVYDSVALERLVFIRQCRTLGISIKEIATLLHRKETPDESCNEVNQLIAKHLLKVQEKICELQGLQITLEQLSNECSGRSTIQTCGIFSKLEST